MTEPNDSKTYFAGTYFERDSIIRLARLADIFAWITLGYYVVQVLLSMLVTGLQIARGFMFIGGFTDIVQQVMWMFQPVMPGLLYFVGIQAIGKVLLILMDMEDNTRRAARNK